MEAGWVAHVGAGGAEPVGTCVDYGDGWYGNTVRQTFIDFFVKKKEHTFWASRDRGSC